MGCLLRKVLRRLRDESGQSLIVTVSSMAVLLGMSAYGIDVASWYAKRHQVQVVADAAALAAANCLANPGAHSGSINSASVPTCSSATDTTDATTVAIDYAAANGMTITASQVSFGTGTTGAGTVTVTPSGSTPSLFARALGVTNVKAKATSVASWKVNPGGCTTAGQNCDFMFANSSNCSTGSNVLIVSTQGKSTVNGNIQTNGSLDASATGSAGGINGTGTFGPGCSTSIGGNQQPWNTSQPTQASSVISWPIDYSKDFPACSGNTCQANGFPKYCTNTSTNAGGIIFGGATGGMPTPGIIYCAAGAGTGVNVSDPSTWTGAITINSSGNNTFDDTFVGGTINYTGAGGDTISACGWTASGYSAAACSFNGTSPPEPAATTNYPVFYAVSQDPNPSNCAAGTAVSTSCAFSLVSTGNLTLDGDVYVENGTADLNLQGNQSAANTFIEANAIGATLAGNFNGDGPSTTGGAGAGSGTDTLLQ
jgi:Flp pilus assembly protein TadG